MLSTNLNKLLVLFFSLLVFSFACKRKTQEPEFQNKSVGVLIVYFDPGIDHQRATDVLNAAKSIGVKWIRVGFIWAIANPFKDQFDFSEYDWLLNTAADYGFKILPVVIFTPKWASACPDSQDYYLYPPTDSTIGSFSANLGSYGTGYDYLFKFAQTIASRYKNIVDHWEFWNEPDMVQSLKSPDTSGVQIFSRYAKMLAYFYSGIKSANPNAKVILGGLADNAQNPDCRKNFAYEILADSVYPAKFYFDIYNIHTNFRPIPEILQQIEANRNLISQFNCFAPIWITETSYTSDPRFQIIDNYNGGQQGFASYVYDALLAQLQTEAEVIFWAALHDYKPEEPDSFPYKYSGLFTYDLSPKKAAQAFKLLAEKTQ